MLWGPAFMPNDMILVKKQVSKDKDILGAEWKILEQFENEIYCKKQILHACEAFLIHFAVCDQVGLQLF